MSLHGSGEVFVLLDTEGEVRLYYHFYFSFFFGCFYSQVSKDQRWTAPGSEIKSGYVLLHPYELAIPDGCLKIPGRTLNSCPWKFQLWQRQFFLTMLMVGVLQRSPFHPYQILSILKECLPQGSLLAS